MLIKINATYTSSSFCPQFINTTKKEIARGEWNDAINDIHIIHSDDVLWWRTMIRLWNKIGLDPVVPNYDGLLPVCKVLLKQGIITHTNVPEFDGLISFGNREEHRGALFYFGPLPLHMNEIINKYLVDEQIQIRMCIVIPDSQK